jgi:3-phenylpropionate/trans-cinnamate dioxygenase ferredoxin subunit
MASTWEPAETSAPASGWLPAGRLSDLAPGKVRLVTDGADLNIAVCNVDGEIYAIEDVCTHDGGPLDQGELEGVEIECPRHGARFDVTDGRATCLPAIMPVKVYPVRVENGEIQIQVE